MPDSVYAEARALAFSLGGRLPQSTLQRKLRLGHQVADSVLDRLEADGVIGSREPERRALRDAALESYARARAALAHARTLLQTRYPAAQLDGTGQVTAAGFMCGPANPGSTQVRVTHRTVAGAHLSRDAAAAQEHDLVSVYAELLREHGWSVREVRTYWPCLLLSPPACPDCATATAPFEADGEAIWRCPACRRRTYGSGDEDHDADLPSYTETDADGTVTVYHGTGEIDIEATAEWATQDAEDAHAECIEPHFSADGYVDCDGRPL